LAVDVKDDLKAELGRIYNLDNRALAKKKHLGIELSFIE
jgi:hypothetical protein